MAFLTPFIVDRREIFTWDGLRAKHAQLAGRSGL